MVVVAKGLSAEVVTDVSCIGIRSATFSSATRTGPVFPTADLAVRLGCNHQCRVEVQPVDAAAGIPLGDSESGLPRW